MRPPAAGDRINNYLLEELIGAGTFGQVWKARHHVFNDAVAIKIPTDAQYVRNLRREGVAVHGLRHPNIVRAIDLDPYAEQPYLVMEYVDGPSLRQIIEQHPAGMPIPAVVAVMQGVLAALDAAHRANLVHRDIKPENILIAGGKDLDGMDAARVKVADFGLGAAGRLTTASIMQSGSMTTEAGRSISGTIAYMSPEQRDGLPVDARSDLYSCGVVLFEMLTGERPAGTELPSHLRSDVPAWLDEVFQRLYTRYERRFASATEVLEALNAARPPRVVPSCVMGRRGRGRVRGAYGWCCDGCGGPVEAGDRFCIHCGSQLVDDVPSCPACHGVVSAGDRYCTLCGQSL